MPSYLHISFNFMARPTKTDELLPAFSKALDWVRYAPNCWIVWTSADPAFWYARLKPLVHDDDSIFICEMNINSRAGYLPVMVWDWLLKDRANILPSRDSETLPQIAPPKLQPNPLLPPPPPPSPENALAALSRLYGKKK
jgi:hypothetical protein